MHSLIPHGHCDSLRDFASVRRHDVESDDAFLVETIANDLHKALILNRRAGTVYAVDGTGHTHIPHGQQDKSAGQQDKSAGQHDKSAGQQITPTTSHT